MVVSCTSVHGYAKLLTGNTCGCSSIHIRYKKAYLLLKRRLTQNATQELESIIKDQPDYFLAYEGLGEADLFQSDLDTFETYFQKAISLNDQLWESYNFPGVTYDK